MTVGQKGEHCKNVSSCLFISNSYFRFSLILVPCPTDEKYWVFPIRHECWRCTKPGCLVIQVTKYYAVALDIFIILLVVFPLTHTMEQRPPWRGNRRSASLEIPLHFIELKGLLLHSQEPTTCPYPELDQTSPCPPPIPLCEEPS